jgi:hypothetical protein
LSQRIRAAFESAEHLPKDEANGQLCAIAASIERFGAEYMEPWISAQGFNVEAMKDVRSSDASEGERYWDRYAILGILRPLLSCRHADCVSRWGKIGFPTMCLHGHLMHMQGHGWTGKDAAKWLYRVAGREEE